MTKIDDFVNSTRREVDKRISRIIKKTPEYEKYKYALEGGKRLRPILAVLIFRCLQGKDYDRMLQAAASLEFVHSASLVHDDIIDMDKKRRGKPSAYVFLGDEDAILFGHRMISLGLRNVINHGTEVLRIILDTWDSALRGESVDVEVMKKKLKEIRTPAEKFYFDIIVNKTASLFSGAAEIGAEEAGTTKEIQDLVSKYGEMVGIAYQLADDYVDMRKGKIETLPLILLSQLEESVKNSLLKLIDEGKLNLFDLLKTIDFDAKRFFKSEAEKAVKEAEKIAESEKIPGSNYKLLLKQIPRYFVNLMTEEVGEKWFC